MTTGGEGGMLLLRDEAVWRRAWSYKDHGKDWDAVYNREHPPGFRDFGAFPVPTAPAPRSTRKKPSTTPTGAPNTACPWPKNWAKPR